MINEREKAPYDIKKQEQLAKENSQI